MGIELYPELSQHLSPDTFQLLLVLLQRLRPVLDTALAHKSNRDKLLPEYVASFLCAALQIDAATLSACWTILLPKLDSLGEAVDYHRAADNIFRTHGPEYKIGAECFYPPYVQCPRDGCQRALGEPISVACRLYTLQRGVLPATSTSLYCRGCNTRYHPNWSVTDSAKGSALRQYYPGIPQYLHVRETIYFDRDFCLFIENEMALSQVSANNIATVYNYAIAPAGSPSRIRSHLSDLLSYKAVLDAFFLHALLRDHSRRDVVLYLPHGGPQETRYDAALRVRNDRLRRDGQEMWDHACDDCCKFLDRSDGTKVFITAGVTDGVTVGHPCCSVLNCQQRLSGARDRFCPSHQNRMGICAVEGCTRPATLSHATCTDPSHRAWERNKRRNRRRGNAFELLSKKLRDAGQGAYVPPSLPPEPVDPPTSTASLNHSDVSPSTPGTAKEKRSKPDDESPINVEEYKGRIYRRWTHNEQLFVSCCGVIKSRATFFGSEGVIGVILWLKHVFDTKRYPGCLPCYIFYDNNCNLVAALDAAEDDYFDNVGLPVDVFHAIHKHNEEDHFCQRHCNPASYPDLVTMDGEWLFNSSVAEQVNRWFGGFQRLVREMTTERYHFYLDEVITIRNRVLVESLYKRGKHPHRIPASTLAKHPVRAFA